MHCVNCFLQLLKYRNHLASYSFIWQEDKHRSEESCNLPSCYLLFKFFYVFKLPAAPTKQLTKKASGINIQENT